MEKLRVSLVTSWVLHRNVGDGRITVVTQLKDSPFRINVRDTRLIEESLVVCKGSDILM